jgi:hypothetical protein
MDIRVRLPSYQVLSLTWYNIVGVAGVWRQPMAAAINSTGIIKNPVAARIAMYSPRGRDRRAAG